MLGSPNTRRLRLDLLLLRLESESVCMRRSVGFAHERDAVQQLPCVIQGQRRTRPFLYTLSQALDLEINEKSMHAVTVPGSSPKMSGKTPIVGKQVEIGERSAIWLWKVSTASEPFSY